jgi:hypothetical protein
MSEIMLRPTNALDPCSDCGNFDPHTIKNSSDSDDVLCSKTECCLKGMAAILWTKKLQPLPQEEGIQYIAITNSEQIKRCLISNSSATWGNGIEIEDGWIRLALFSPSRQGDRQTMFICQKNHIAEKFQQFVRYAQAK